MKSPVAILLVVLLMAANASAQYTTPQQRAKNVSAATTERQNVTPEGNPGPNAFNSRYGIKPGQPPGAPAAPAPGTPPPAATPVAPAAPVKPSSQQTAATKLRADIAEASAKGEATAEMKKQFVQDLGVAVLGRSRPSSATLAKFGESLLTALAAKKAAPPDDAKLVKAVVVSLNSAGLPASRVQEINAEVRAVLTKSGVPDAEVGLVAENLGAVVSDIQSAAPN